MTLDYAHDRPIRYEQNAEGGLWYLRNLSAGDAKKLFDEAYHGDGHMAHFTHGDFGYILTYQYNDGDYYYTLVRGHNPAFD